MQNRITFSNVIGVLLENKKKTYAQYRMIEDIFFDCLSNMDLFEKDYFEKNVILANSSAFLVPITSTLSATNSKSNSLVAGTLIRLGMTSS